MQIVSPTGKYMAGFSVVRGSAWATMRDLRKGRDVIKASIPLGAWSRALAFSNNERRLVYVPNDGIAIAFSLPSGRRRRLGKVATPGEYHLGLDVRRAFVTDDGFVCANRGFHKYSTCEHDVLFSLTGRKIPEKRPRQLKCIDAPGGARVVSVPAKALTSQNRTVLRSHNRVAAACNIAVSADGKRAAWFEGREGIGGMNGLSGTPAELT